MSTEHILLFLVLKYRIHKIISDAYLNSKYNNKISSLFSERLYFASNHYFFFNMFFYPPFLKNLYK